MGSSSAASPWDNSNLWHWGSTGAPVQAHSSSPHGVKPASESQGHPGQLRALRVSPCGQGSPALAPSPRGEAQQCPTSPFSNPGTVRGSAPSQNSARQVIKTLKNPTLKKPKLQHRPEKGRKEFHSSHRDGKQRSGACTAGGKFHLHGRSRRLRTHPRLTHGSPTLGTIPPLS